jgi:putative PIG3 family NAD(P)H quinone oxidoreductase
MGQAVFIRGAGDVDVLEIADYESRKPGHGEVAVDVAAAGLNRADCLQRRGFYPAPSGSPPDIPGLEFAGTVSALGEGVSSWSIGDRVMGIAGGGGMATSFVTHERTLVAVPDGMSLEQAAAVPEVFFTAYDALFDRGSLAVGETALIHSVGSGVGTAALQIALAAGASVIGTSRTASKLERCGELGLSQPVLVEGGQFAKAVKSHTAGRGADVVLDTIGAAYFEENIRAVAVCGRIVIIGLLGGVTATAPLGPLLAKRVTVVGSVLRSRPLEQKAALTQKFAAHMLPKLADGSLRPIVDDVMPMTKIAEAHQRMERNETFGKLVMAWA